MALWDSESFVLKTKISFTQKEVHLLFGFQEKERGFFSVRGMSSIGDDGWAQQELGLNEEKNPSQKTKKHIVIMRYLYMRFWEEDKNSTVSCTPALITAVKKKKKMY